MAEKRPVRKSVDDEPEQQQQQVVVVSEVGARRRRRNHGSSTSLTLNPGFRLCHTSEGSDAESDRGVCQKLRSLTLGRRYKSKSLDGPEASTSDGLKEKRKGRWNLKFNYKIRGGATESTDLPETGSDSSCSCVCTGYRRTEEHHLGAGVVFDSTSSLLQSSSSRGGGGSCSSSSESSSRTRHGNPSKAGKSTSKRSTAVTREPVIDFSKFNPDDYPTEDCDEKARAQRAWEMEEGVDPPPGYNPNTSEEVESRFVELRERHSFLIPFVHPLFPISHSPRVSVFTRSLVQSGSSSVPGADETQLSRISTDSFHQLVHSQVDYIHCLVPDLLEISNCGFYWGKMDRYEAERLLENKPEGTFLLRDSAQEDYLFSVSFRRYGRSLHARIEQWNHKFSFDSHDPGVFSSDTVCGLIEHYKDPSCCMFFEPMLTLPLYRTFTFLLQHLCRSAICRMVTYDGVNQLQLPKPLKAYLKEYHYKQRVRLRRLDVEQ